VVAVPRLKIHSLTVSSQLAEASSFSIRREGDCGDGLSMAGERGQHLPRSQIPELDGVIRPIWLTVARRWVRLGERATRTCRPGLRAGAALPGGRIEELQLCSCGCNKSLPVPGKRHRTKKAHSQAPRRPGIGVLSLLSSWQSFRRYRHSKVRRSLWPAAGRLASISPWARHTFPSSQVRYARFMSDA